MCFKNLVFFTICILSFTIVSCNSKSNDEKKNENTDTNNNWTKLFNGNNLEGWEVLGGDGNFFVENKAIVGETKMGVKSSFLATKKLYDNFELELEFKIDTTLNSGIQIRSSKYKKDTTTSYLSGSLEKITRDWNPGRVHGYQVEIDPSDRAWTGGFYEEGGRGWLQPLTDNNAAQKAFKQNEWNTFRIIADGNHFETYLNGVQATNYDDSLASKGFIALQLHEIYDDKQAGKRVMFRNIKIKEFN